MQALEELSVALAQMQVKTLAVEDNLARGEALIRRASESGADLVMLPELWATGFHWPKNLGLEGSFSQIRDKVAGFARKYKIWVAGTLLDLNVEGRCVNAFVLFASDGSLVARYEKMHLFSLTGEDRYLAGGNEIVCAETPWGKIGLTVCYDFRFPELWRALALQGARLILCPAGVPEPRLKHWQTLLHARAIENQCFVAAVNQIGTERIPGGPPLTYFGHSMLIDPWGKTLLEADGQESVSLATILSRESDEVRQRMTVLQDRRPEYYPNE